MEHARSRLLVNFAFILVVLATAVIVIQTQHNQAPSDSSASSGTPLSCINGSFTEDFSKQLNYITTFKKVSYSLRDIQNVDSLVGIDNNRLRIANDHGTSLDLDKNQVGVLTDNSFLGNLDMEVTLQIQRDLNTQFRSGVRIMAFDEDDDPTAMSALSSTDRGWVTLQNVMDSITLQSDVDAADSENRVDYSEQITTTTAKIRIIRNLNTILMYADVGNGYKEIGSMNTEKPYVNFHLFTLVSSPSSQVSTAVAYFDDFKISCLSATQMSSTTSSPQACQPVAQCTDTKPFYCNAQGQAINNCQQCGCPQVMCITYPCPIYQCQDSGSCELILSTTEEDKDAPVHNLTDKAVSCGYLDSNDNSVLDAVDLAAFTFVWGKNCNDDTSFAEKCGPKDKNNNKKIDVIDLANFIDKWGIDNCNN